jgi:glycerophosphoryl diester phosphodiesterase
MTLISAHRCGAGDETSLENTRTALLRALDLGVDLVEFDVQRCADGTFVVHHDSAVDIAGVPTPLEELSYAQLTAHHHGFLRYDEVLHELAGRARAHIDLKFTSPAPSYADPASTHEVAASREAVDVLGAAGVIITTLEDESVRAVRAWSREQHPELLVGLSLGRDVREMRRLHGLRTRLSELRPGRRYSATDANLVVGHHLVARLGVARWARRRRLPMLVWTVDDRDALAYWIGSGRAWAVTTNYPEVAVDVRGETRRREG